MLLELQVTAVAAVEEEEEKEEEEEDDDEDDNGMVAGTELGEVMLGMEEGKLLGELKHDIGSLPTAIWNDEEDDDDGGGNDDEDDDDDGVDSVETSELDKGE